MAKYIKSLLNFVLQSFKKWKNISILYILAYYCRRIYVYIVHSVIHLIDVAIYIKLETYTHYKSKAIPSNFSIPFEMMSLKKSFFSLEWNTNLSNPLIEAKLYALIYANNRIMQTY